MYPKFLIALTLITSLGTLSGCGQKGPLYLPQTDGQSERSALKRRAQAIESAKEAERLKAEAESASKSN